MSPKIWNAYPLDIVTRADGKAVILIASNATPEAVAEEVRRQTFAGILLAHVLCEKPALTPALAGGARVAAFVLAAHAPLLEYGTQLVINGQLIPVTALDEDEPEQCGHGFAEHCPEGCN
jgi:hypothetical protein